MIFPGEQVRRRALAAAVILAVLVTAGCEPLAKKFVRKKKPADESSQIIPVLDPVDYPAKVETGESLYRQQYSLWVVWQGEVLRGFEDQVGDKKLRFDFDKMLDSLVEMKRLVQGSPQEELAKALEKMQGCRRELDKPEGIRDDDSIRRKVDSVSRMIRRDFKPERLSEAFLP